MFPLPFPAIISLLVFVMVRGEDHKIPGDLTSHKNWNLLDRGDDCGISVSNRIIGGTEATLGQFPWMALLMYSKEKWEGKKPEKARFNCGGAVISNRYVLTAAHCSSEQSDEHVIAVRLGEHFLLKSEDCQKGVCADPVQDIGVEKEICHPDFSKNDICLLRLMEDIKFNDFVEPICLPVFDFMSTDDYKGEVMEVAGWGYTDYKAKSTSDTLMVLKVPVISLKACNRKYKRAKSEITSKQLCAGGVIGKDSCNGDSGGPLMKSFSVNTVPRYFIVGVVSFGPVKCAELDVPGIYTRVSAYLKWILDTVEK